MTSFVEITSRTVAAACPESAVASRPEGLVAAGLPGLGAPSLGVARLRGTGMAAWGMPASVLRVANERPTQAPAAVTAQAHAYAAVNGAGDRTEWIDGSAVSFTETVADVTKKQQIKRAFRGLEPWRDPA